MNEEENRWDMKGVGEWRVEGGEAGGWKKKGEKEEKGRRVMKEEGERRGEEVMKGKDQINKWWEGKEWGNDE